MARVNQGIFKEKLNKFKDLEYDYISLIEDYDKGNYRDFFEEFAPNADHIYCNSVELSKEFKDLLRYIKFEKNSEFDKYLNLLSKTDEIRNNVKTRFNEYLGLLEYDGLTDIEKETLSGYKIYRDSLYRY